MALHIRAQHKMRTADRANGLLLQRHAAAARSVCSTLERTAKVRVTQQHTAKAQSLAWCQHVRADGHACSRGMRAYAAKYKPGGWSRVRLCSLANASFREAVRLHDAASASANRRLPLTSDMCCDGAWCWRVGCAPGTCSSAFHRDGLAPSRR